MKFTTHIILCITLIGIPTVYAVGAVPDTALTYRGTSDASAAMALDSERFLVADDEKNILRAYSTRQGSLPIYFRDLNSFLQIDSDHPEADIEGATRMGDRIYWITSHGRNKDGKLRPNRYRFFATTVKLHNGKITVQPIGKPCKTLIHRLIKSPSARGLGLDKTTRFGSDSLMSKKNRKKLAPKKEGLNIEALAASPNGQILYIGFRNPRPLNQKTSRPQALVIPLMNAPKVIDKNASPLFGKPLLWDLAGLGLRSMEYSSFHKTYFIIAGAHDESSYFSLYRWSGKISDPPQKIRNLLFPRNHFTPEALIPFDNSPRLFLLSDDGSVEIKVSSRAECTEDLEDGKCPNKFLANPSRKTFRGLWLKP